MNGLERGMFAVPADVLAPRLIGMRLVRMLDDGRRVSGEIVETEAYLGARDRACHTFGGRRTARTEAMYASAGFAYVYFTYGMHCCVNVVCGVGSGPDGGGVGEAVLIRALRPMEGLEEMKRLRGGRRGDGGCGLRERDLCSGPGKLCQALQIGLALNGQDLLTAGPLMIEAGVGAGKLRRTARIGIDSAGAWATRRLRWFEAGCEHVSVRGRVSR